MNHYPKEATEKGCSSAYSMEDEIVRERETQAIISTIRAHYLRMNLPLKVFDFGCGNGHTIHTLLGCFPDFEYFAVDTCKEAMDLCKQRFIEHPQVKLEYPKERCDVVICQRVLINMLSLSAQHSIVSNLITNYVCQPTVWTSGGIIIFLECFEGPLKNLNEARLELYLVPIEPAAHNLYLPNEFFDKHSELKPFLSESVPPPNFLSSHYYISRVLHPGLGHTGRNSHFVKFFSNAINNTGDYAPLKLYVMELR